LAAHKFLFCFTVLAILCAGSDGISSALQAWGDLATRMKRLPFTDRSGLRLGSQLTLLRLVAGLAGRVRGLLPPGETAGTDCTAAAKWPACMAGLLATAHSNTLLRCP
jgi:hypothetical protein